MWNKCNACFAFYQLTCISFAPFVFLFSPYNLQNLSHLAHITNISARITQLRKDRGWSQDELAGQINSSRAMIGKYERGGNLPSIEVLVKLAQTFGVSVDYLVGEGQHAAYDKEMVKRLDQIEHLPAEEKQRIYHFMDLIIRDHATKKAYSS